MAHVRDVAKELIQHPFEHLIVHWNWKSALLSSAVRGVLVFSANAVAGFRTALGASMVELIYRGATSGFSGSVIESFRTAEPYWAGQLTALLIVPAISDSLEVFAQHWRGIPNLYWNTVLSLSFTFASTAFNYYAMRQGSFIVGEGRRRLIDDIRAFPCLVLSFLKIVGRQLVRPFVRMKP